MEVSPWTVTGELLFLHCGRVPGFQALRSLIPGLKASSHCLEILEGFIELDTDYMAVFTVYAAFGFVSRGPLYLDDSVGTVKGYIAKFISHLYPVKDVNMLIPY